MSAATLLIVVEKEVVGTGGARYGVDKEQELVWVLMLCKGVISLRASEEVPL